MAGRQRDKFEHLAGFACFLAATRRTRYVRGVARRALSLVLLVALVLGLTGQAPAMGQTPQAGSAASAQPTDEDCAAMMAGHEQPRKSPCDGTLHCMLAMGCLSLNLVPEAGATIASDSPASPPQYWPAVATLHGTSSPPDTDPPNALG